MCLAIPAKVVEVTGEEQARIDIVGVQKDISTALVDDVKVGDYLLIHVGHAIGRVDPDEAEKNAGHAEGNERRRRESLGRGLHVINDRS